MRSFDWVRRAAAVVLAGGTLCAAAPEPLPADALFNAAREARSAGAYAHYAVYLTVVRFRRGTHHVVDSYQTTEDLRRRVVHAHSLPVEEAAHPHTGSGDGLTAGFGPSGVQFGVPPAVRRPGYTDDPIGPVTFAADQDFGLALNAPAIAASANMGAVASAVLTLPRIGRTGTIVRTYDVTNLGDVTEGSVTLHHLALVPLREPKRFRLRELWSDAKSSLPVRVVVAGVGNRGPLQNIGWRVDFAQIQGGTFVARETALAPLDTSKGRVEDATISFEELRLTNQLAPYEQLGLTEDVGTSDP